LIERNIDSRKPFLPRKQAKFVEIILQLEVAKPKTTLFTDGTPRSGKNGGRFHVARTDAPTCPNTII
jgi:hypothetical protein